MGVIVNEINISNINFSDGKKRVLILGNGVSRLQYMNSFVSKWKDAPIWACNSAYTELESGAIPRLDAITGDKQALKDALVFREKKKLSFIVYARSQTTYWIPGTERIDIPDKYIYDSGTTLVVKALLSGYNEVYLVGFDLGGKDIYVKDHEDRNKASWIFRWRIISQDLGLSKIIFVGRDHKEFIDSSKPIDSYARVYMRGDDHLITDIDTPPKTENANQVLILGNGVSRNGFQDFIRKWSYELWGCNDAYLESTKYKITRIGSVHDEKIREAYDFRENNKLSYWLIGRRPMPDIPKDYLQFKKDIGWSTGSLFLCQAVLEGFDKIHVAGFDFGGEDLYTDPKNGSTFRKQFIETLRLYPTLKSKLVFHGPKPTFIEV